MPQAWNLISAAPARAAGLADRGVLAEGHRADIILVDDQLPLRPRIVAVIAAGRLVHLTDASRLIRSSVALAQGGCSGVSRLYAADMTDAFHATRFIMSPRRGSDLDRFGAHLLGYDAFSGDGCRFPTAIEQRCRTGAT